MNTRITEMSAAIYAQRIVKELHELATDPSGKRFTASCANRKAKWAELLTISEKQLQSFAEPEPAPVVTATADSAPVTPVSA